MARFSSRLLAAATMLLAATTLLEGCAHVPNLGAKPALRSAKDIAAERSFTAEPKAIWPTEDWWRAFGDPQLDRLIQQGLSGSPDLDVAVARVSAAQAQLREAGGALGPQGQVNATVGGVKQSYNYGIPPAFVPRGINDAATLNAQLGFDLDLWGRNRASLRALRAQGKAAAFDLSQARLTIATAIAEAYAQFALLSADRTAATEAVAVRTRTRSLVEARIANGLDTQAEAGNAAADVFGAKAEVAAIEEQLALTRNQLAALIGAGPDAGLSLSPPALERLAVHELPANATTELMARRPDLGSARALVEAADERIRVARADYYPSINLQALVGLQALGIGNLLKAGSLYGNAGPALSLPLFHGAQLGGRYAGARANFDEAVARYNGIVITAYREVADAVTSRAALVTRLGERRSALAGYRKAAQVADLRYRGGLSTYLDVLNAQRSVLTEQRQVADLEARAFFLDVQLVRALGGGFLPPNLTATVHDKDALHG